MFGEDHARGPFLDPPVRARSCHIALQFGRIGHPGSLGQLGRLLGNGQGTPPHCRCQNRWGIGQVHTSCMPWRRAGLELPSWSSLADGARPVLARGDIQDQPRCGWQREVSLIVEQHFRDTRLLPTMTARSSSVTLTRRPSGGRPVHQLPHRQAVPD